MQAIIKDNNLIITIPVGPASKARLSSTGKTYLLASESAKNAVQHDGKDISIQVNATFKP